MATTGGHRRRRKGGGSGTEIQVWRPAPTCGDGPKYLGPIAEKEQNPTHGLVSGRKTPGLSPHPRWKCGQRQTGPGKGYAVSEPLPSPRLQRRRTRGPQGRRPWRPGGLSASWERGPEPGSGAGREGPAARRPSRGPVTWRQRRLLLPVRRSAPGGGGGGGDSPNNPQRRAEPGPSPPPSAPPPPSPLSQDMVSAGPRAAPGCRRRGQRGGEEARRRGAPGGGGREEGDGLGRCGFLMAATEGTRSQINPTANSTTSRPDPSARSPVIGPKAASGAANGRPPLSGRRRRASERDVTSAPGPDCEEATRTAPRLRPSALRG
ncbi:translation initiation factor IF-2-like [Choloepus didactylus]|uniref:translation initiation factor IF-2-like n=1 Tax=Choloepus didactylus TaxID=27675 RepID=UPI00189D8F04|nr:translation initiation factor IF-2-like [Choloepus didactylus]